MAMTKCIECGKEISDKAVSCPHCGCPNKSKSNLNIRAGEVKDYYFEKQDNKNNNYIYSSSDKEQKVGEPSAKELPPEDVPKMFECYKCGRPLPEDIEKCPYCDYNYGTYRSNKNGQFIYREEKGVSTSNASGAKRACCPNCGSENITISMVQSGSYTASWGKAKKARIKGDSLTFNSHQKVAICQECGHSWDFYSEQDKLNIKIRAIVALVIIGLIAYWLFDPFGKPSNEDKSDTPTYSQVNNDATKDEEVEVTGSTMIDTSLADFDYELVGDQIKLTGYNGDKYYIMIPSHYVVSESSYEVNLEELQIIDNDVKTVVFRDGINSIKTSIFNGCDVERIYVPKSMTCIYDATLSYIDGTLDTIFYGGTQEEWNQIYQHYDAGNVADKIDEGDYEGAGTALADKINKMVGADFDISSIDLAYNQNLDELLRE